MGACEGWAPADVKGLVGSPGSLLWAVGLSPRGMKGCPTAPMPRGVSWALGTHALGT